MQHIGYSNFINKNGKIVFPLSFLFLFIGFIAPLFYDRTIFHTAKMAMSCSYYIFLPSIITSPISLRENVYLNRLDIPYFKLQYPTYQDYFEAMLPSVIFSCILSIIALTILCCAIAFLVLYFAKHKTNKGLLIAIPSLYLLMVVTICAVGRVIPFAGFYTTLIFLILAIMYCTNAQLLPKPRTPREHKPTKDERIAELERQVAELIKKQGR